MEYSAPPFFKHGPSLLTRFTFFSLLSITLLVADARLGYLPKLRQVVGVVVYPVQRLSAVPAELSRRVSEFFVTQAELERENELLKQQNLANTAALQTQQALIAENRHLRELLAMSQRLQRSYLGAEILYSARDPFTRRVVVDKGFQHGVQEGLPVVDQVGVVGQVTRVFPWLSEVTLVTDKEQTIPIQVLRSGLRGVTFGMGYDGALELRFMPVNADIENGDVLVTSGIDGTYPPGLPVAIVSNIERNSAYAFARVTCKPAAGISSYGQVLIVLGERTLPANPSLQVDPGVKGKRPRRND